MAIPTTPQDLLIDGLNDAYAMEVSQVQRLQEFINNFRGSDTIKNHLVMRLEETRQQRDDLASCLESLGEKPNTGAKPAGDTANSFSSFATMHAGDHFEYARYVALARTAKKAGQREIANICRHMAEEELDAADWAEQQIDKAVDSAAEGF